MDIKVAASMLRELAELAHEASLTGALSGGEGRAVRRYNQLISQLSEQGDLPAGLFAPLADDETFAAIALEARLAASSFDKQDRPHHADGDLNMITRLAPFVSSDDLRDLIKSANEDALGPDFLTSVAPFLDREALSELVKAHLVRATDAVAPPVPPVPPVAPEPPIPEPSVTAFATDQSARNVARLVSRLSEAGLSEEQRQQILRQIAEAASGA
jgi:hypothetical protein